MPGQQTWTALVDGASGLKNFDRIGDANWRAEDGAIVADKAKVASYLISKSSYKDFQIRAEFWADHTTNSGIFMRLSNTKEVTAANSYEFRRLGCNPAAPSRRACWVLTQPTQSRFVVS